MTLRAWVDAATRRFPSYDVAPRTRARHHALTAARDAREQMIRRPEAAVSYFPYAASSPARSYRLNSGLTISLDDRWAIFGFKGCGKTTLARQLIKGYRRCYPMAALYVLDSKGDGLFDRDPNLSTSSAPPAPLQPGRSIVWRPDDDDLEAYDAWLQSILKARRPAIVYIDELASLGRNSAQSYVPAYARILKQGRSLHQAVITLTQDAAYIPRQVSGQLDHLIRMRLEDEYDARKLDRKVHGTDKERREPLRPHGLWYKRLGRASDAQEYGDWHEFLV